MAQWLYRIVPSRPEMVSDPTDDEERIVGEHFSYLLHLRDRGTLILAGRTQDAGDTFGITIFEADDEAAARSIMDADPGVAGGVFVATLHPYRIAVARDGVAG